MTIINATEGGAKLEGSEQMTLEEAIAEYAFNKYPLKDLLGMPIDKSVLTPLLSEVKNSKELISKSIKLMNSDIKELKEIIELSQQSLILLKHLKGKNSNKKKFGKRLNKQAKVTLKTKKLVDKNPLVAMSVFWASKTIAQNKYSSARQEIKDKLKDNSTKELEYFYTKEGKEVLGIRIEASTVVMKASNASAKDLLKAYKGTLVDMKLLEKDGKLVYGSINPKPHLKDAEEYFKNGNWGHNLIEAMRMVNKESGQIPPQAARIVVKCEMLRAITIVEAKENYDRKGKDKIIKYNHFVEKAHKAGRNQKEGQTKERNFNHALNYLEKAIKFDPERPEAKWGLATTYHGMGDLEQSTGNLEKASYYQTESIKAYKELVKEYPDNLQFKFELGLVNLQVGFSIDADKLFNEIFSRTDRYDWFLKNLAELYFKADLIEEAKITIGLYIEKFPFDPRGINLQTEINKEK